MDHPDGDPRARNGRSTVMHIIDVGALPESDRKYAIGGRSRSRLPSRRDSRLSSPVMDFDPNRLIVRIAEQQDRAAFAELFHFYAPRIKSFLMRRGESAETAEDLAQETLVRIWRKAGAFDPTRSDAPAWIFAIARNLKIDAFRRKQRMELKGDTSVLMVTAPDQPEEILINSERGDRVRTAVNTLPPEQLDLVKLSFFDGRSHGEIADITGIPLGTVKSRLRLAFGRLREKLGDLR